MATLALVDTHTLIWAATSHMRLLGRHARRFIEDVEKGRAAAYVSTVTLVEIGEAVYRGTISFDQGYESWIARLASSGRWHGVDLTLAIVLRAHELYEVQERGDRLLAATALELGCPLVTRDATIAQARGIDALW